MMSRRPVETLKESTVPLQTTAFCFVVEGHTEHDYLQIALGVAKPNIIDNPPCTDASNLIRKALIHLGKGGGYKKIFVVFDQDKLQPDSNTWGSIRKQLVDVRDEEIVILYSAPWFDYVLQLHFDNNPSINIDSTKALKKYGFGNHKKEKCRRWLMEHLKKHPAKICLMYRRLLKRDKQLNFSNETTLEERTQPLNTPNSNFYIALKELKKEGLL